MKCLGLALGWLFAAVFSLLTISMVLTKNRIPALALFLELLLCLPPGSSGAPNCRNRSMSSSWDS